MNTRSRAEQLAWAAGIIEADGAIMFKRNPKARRDKYGRLRVVMADEDIILDLHAIFGVGRLRAAKAQHRNSNLSTVNPKPLFLWEVNSQSDLAYVLQLIQPYLHARRGEAAENVLTFLAEEHFQ